MKKYKQKEKIYIDFIGAPASGKSTIRKALYEEMKNDNINVFLSPNHIEREKFKKLQSFYNLLPLIMLNLKSTIKLLYYWYKFKKINKIFGRKPLITENLIFYKNNFNYFLAESSLHAYIHKMNFLKKDLFYLLNFMPTKNCIFIFVDTPPNESFKRLKNRKEVKWKKNINIKEQYKRYYNHKNFYKILKNIKNYKNLYKVIKVSGENPIEKNVKYLKKEILNY